jgi:hypothetical protein
MNFMCIDCKIVGVFSIDWPVFPYFLFVEVIEPKNFRQESSTPITLQARLY